MKRFLAVLVLVAGCASAPAASEEREFDFDGTRYKVTRVETDARPGAYLLWKQEGISWRLVREEPVE